MLPQFIILVVLIAFSAFFSASETALISLTNSKVDELVEKKAKNSRLLKKLKQKPHELLITVLVGNNIVNIAASAYAAVIFIDIFGDEGLGIATAVMTFLILVFGEISPKSFAHQHAVRIATLVAKPIYLIKILLFPLVWFFDLIVHFINWISGTKKAFTVTEGEVVAMLKIGAQEGTIEKHEREFIENVFEFNDIEVEQVMTPRVNIDALDEEMTISEAVDFAIKHSHTRLPIYRENLDQIVGVISIKDLLKIYKEMPDNKKLKSLKLDMPVEVPLSKKIQKLFREFQRRQMHLAVVIDEYGGTAGLVTLEDLLEEIVGEIEDEFDTPERPIQIIDKKTVVANGTALVEDVNDLLKVRFWQDEKDSINTMIQDFLHRFPQEGEIISFPAGKVHVLEMDKNVVKRVKIVRATHRKQE